MQVSATDGYVVVHSGFIARSELFLETYVAMIPSAHLLLARYCYISGSYKEPIGS